MIKFLICFFVISFFHCGFCSHLEQGRVIAFAGISGSGKSTLAKEIAEACKAKMFFEPEESEWPEYARNKHAYSDFSAYTGTRGFRVEAIWKASNLRKNGEMVF